MADKVFTYDCTLRDGEQAEGIALSLEDKLNIVRRLDAFGIDVIEGGFPASNPKDIAFFQTVRQMGLAHAQIAAFGNTCKKGVPAAEDAGLRDLLESGAPVCTIVGKSWDAQVERALQTTLEENLRMVGESVAFLKEHGVRVVFDAEHFFDGYKSNPAYSAGGHPRGPRGRRRFDRPVRDQRRGASSEVFPHCPEVTERFPRSGLSASTATTIPGARWPIRWRPLKPASPRCRGASTAMASAWATWTC